MRSLLRLLPIFTFLIPWISSIEISSKLLLIVCDGFRWDYVDKARKGNYSINLLEQWIHNGTIADHIKPGFVSTTYPNLWTMMTGLTTEHHGIVHNNFHDFELNQTFHGDSSPDFNFYYNSSNSKGREPIWISNQKNGGRSVSSVWPGGTTLIKGYETMYRQGVDYDIAWKTRVDFIIKHFTNVSEPANFGLLYFEEPGKYCNKK